MCYGFKGSFQDYVKNIAIKPEMYSRGSSKKAWWKCKFGHSWQASIGKRTSGRGCPYCLNKLVTLENCLSNTHPNLLKEWDFEKNQTINPDRLTFVSSKKVYWICKNGHNWSAKISHRSNGSNCPECFNLKRKKIT